MKFYNRNDLIFYAWLSTDMKFLRQRRYDLWPLSYFYVNKYSKTNVKNADKTNVPRTSSIEYLYHKKLIKKFHSIDWKKIAWTNDYQTCMIQTLNFLVHSKKDTYIYILI